MNNYQELPKRLRLSTRRDVERRVHELIWVLRDKYRDIRLAGEKVFNPLNLYSTQKYLESDKLGLVLRETLFHGYNVPVIIIRGKASRYYVVDGHHRVRVMLWLRQGVKGFLLDIPEYKPQYSTRINNIELINPPEKTTSPIINGGKQVDSIVFTLNVRIGIIETAERIGLRSFYELSINK